MARYAVNTLKIKLQRRKKHEEEKARRLQEPAPDWNDLKPALISGVETLPWLDQEILRRYYYEEETVEEIGEQMNQTPGRIRRRLKEILDRLKGFLLKETSNGQKALLS